LSDLRLQHACGVRSCPLLSVVHRSAADPARTERGFRSRPVADASGAPVLRDQRPDRPAEHGKADHSVGRSDLLLAKPDRAGASPAKTVKAQVEVVVVLSVGVRSGPLATVVNGTLVARTVRMALVQRGAAGSASTVG
jgi:hypothetical protein